MLLHAVWCSLDVGLLVQLSVAKCAAGFVRCRDCTALLRMLVRAPCSPLLILRVHCEASTLRRLCFALFFLVLQASARKVRCGCRSHTRPSKTMRPTLVSVASMN